MCIRNLISDKTTSAGVLQGPTTLWSLLLVSGSSSIQPIKKKKKKKSMYTCEQQLMRNQEILDLRFCSCAISAPFEYFPFSVHLIYI